MSDISGILTRLALVEQKVKAEFSLQINLQAEAAKLATTLKEVQIVLEEAERRRLTDPRVRAWLEKLGSVTYEINDTLDVFDSTKLHLLMVDNHQSNDDDSDDDDAPKTLQEKISTFVQSLCLCIRRVVKRRDIALAIRALNERVDVLAKEKIKYDMLPISSEFRGDDLVKTEVNTAFSEIVAIGSQNDFTRTLIKDLKSELENKYDGRIPVISLLGMAGIGKTTVARLVYNDEEFAKEFKIKSWISVSNFFDEIRVAKAILESASGGDTFQHVSEFQALLEKIKSVVSGKNIFLVLDDVWIKDDHKWKQIRESLNYAVEPGSVILVTTRNGTAARLMGSNEKAQIKPVEVISDADCWSILKKIAFEGRLSDGEEMGQILAKKCKGLPLAAKTLGNHLLSIRNKISIRYMLEKEFWEMEEVAKPIFASFSFSYYELPLEVRRCFLFCSTLPKTYLDDATRSWISVLDMINLCGILGYLNSNRTKLEKSKMSSKEKLMKLTFKGIAYFDKLHDCSLLQIHKLGSFDYYSCQMHVLFHDFARYLMKTSRGEEENRCCFFTHNLVSDDFVPLKSAGVLYVTHGQVTELGEEIGNLIHLRVLSLKETKITELPKTICNLFNLQTLDLSKCENLLQFPEGFSKLRNLRQLWIKGAKKLNKRGIEELTGLQTLGDEYLVGNGADLGLLKKLNQLEGSLTIKIKAQLNSDEDAEEAWKAKLVKKKRLRNLKLVLKKEVSMDVINCLQAPPNLQRLTLAKYNVFPTWINSSSLGKLEILEFRESTSCTRLPLLGTLPRLKSIVLESLDSLILIGPDFWGITDSTERELFPKLESLRIINCKKLKTWNDINGGEGGGGGGAGGGGGGAQFSVMPCLRHIYLENCPELTTLPRQLLLSLETLDIKGSPLLSQR